MTAQQLNHQSNSALQGAHEPAHLHRPALPQGGNCLCRQEGGVLWVPGAGGGGSGVVHGVGQEGQMGAVEDKFG